MKGKEMVKKAEKLVKATARGRDASHDAAHSCRVRDLALSLAIEEGLGDPSSANYSSDSLEVVELAALLHDIGDYKYTKDQKDDISIVEKFLSNEGLEHWKKEKIMKIIMSMGFKNEVARASTFDSSVEFCVVQDADRLDAIGAIGIARCFTFGGSKNRPLYDPSVPPRTELTKANYMNKEETQPSINHFHEKLLKLKDMMKTKAGQRRAEARHEFMLQFLKEFHEEWEGRA
ncbi:metal-dependent phosphohydrolase [Wolffia australiana]